MKPLVTTVREVLLDAIREEMESRGYFRELAAHTSDADAKKKLLDLADTEVVRRAKLETKFRDRVGEEPPDSEPTPATMPEDLHEIDLRRALRVALEHERRAEGNYRHLAERAESKDLKTLFLELAETKWSHKSEIEAEYNALADPDDFFEDL